jgi:hypothetical protein
VRDGGELNAFHVTGGITHEDVACACLLGEFGNPSK